jgi:hypothetical protein
VTLHLPNFHYLAPKDTGELAAMLSDHGDSARILSGGKDLLVQMKSPGCGPTMGVAACLTAVGRPDDAARAIEQALAMNADVTITSTQAVLGPIASNRLMPYVEALRGAGLPE